MSSAAPARLQRGARVRVRVPQTQGETLVINGTVERLGHTLFWFRDDRGRTWTGWRHRGWEVVS